MPIEARNVLQSSLTVARLHSRVNTPASLSLSLFSQTVSVGHFSPAISLRHGSHSLQTALLLQRVPAGPQYWVAPQQHRLRHMGNEITPRGSRSHGLRQTRHRTPISHSTPRQLQPNRPQSATPSLDIIMSNHRPSTSEHGGDLRGRGAVPGMHTCQRAATERVVEMVAKAYCDTCMRQARVAAKENAARLATMAADTHTQNTTSTGLGLCIGSDGKQESSDEKHGSTEYSSKTLHQSWH